MTARSGHSPRPFSSRTPRDANSIPREHDPNWRANARRSSSSRPNSHPDECRAQAVELLERRRAVAGVDVDGNQRPVGQTSAGRVDGQVARVAFRLIGDNQDRLPASRALQSW